MSPSNDSMNEEPGGEAPDRNNSPDTNRPSKYRRLNKDDSQDESKESAADYTESSAYAPSRFGEMGQYLRNKRLSVVL